MKRFTKIPAPFNTSLGTQFQFVYCFLFGCFCCCCCQFVWFLFSFCNKESQALPSSQRQQEIRAQCFHSLNLIMTPRPAAKMLVLSLMITVSSIGGRKMRPLILTKLETAAALHLYDADIVAEQCLGGKSSHGSLVHLGSCVVQVEPLSLSIYHASLDKAGVFFFFSCFYLHRKC